MRIGYASAIAVLSLVVQLQSVDAQEAGAAAPAPCPLSVVPARVGGLDLIGWEKFPKAELGAVFRYRAAAGFGADVYLYPAAEELDAQIKAFKESLEVYRSRGEFESFQVENEREVKGPGTHPAGKYALATLRRGNLTQRSHFYVYAVGPQNVKVRITYPEGRFSNDKVQAWVDELLAAWSK